MKTIQKTFLISAILLGLGFALAGCVGVVDSGPGYYGHDRWYHDGPWMDGPRGYIGVRVHPMRR